MRSFIDLVGRTWELNVTVGSARRVKDMVAGADLLALADGCQFGRFATDPEFLADVLYALLKPQADARQVSAADFGDALAGESLGAASTALMRAIADFFSAQAIRDGLHRVIDLMQTKLDELARAAAATAKQMSGDSSIAAQG